MKVALINTVCGYGSTGRICTDLAEVIHFSGHECRIYFGRNNAEEAQEKCSERIGTSFDIKLHVLKTRLFDGAGFGSVNATRRLIARIIAYNPDIIHLHNLHGYYINIKILFAYLKQSNKPVLWTLHDCWAFTGHCAHFDFVGCQKWQKECGSCPQKSIYPASFLFDRSHSNFRTKRQLFTSLERLTLVTPSNWLAGKVKKSFLSNVPVHVIYNGIDLAKFQPTQSGFREKYGLQNKSIILGVATDWIDRKGLQYFVDMAGILDSSFQIVLVGVTKKQSLKLPKNIISIRRTNSIVELSQIYTAADIFVNPTMEEVLGLVNLEALACGTPVITFDTGGSSECIDTSCGIVVKKGNMSELIDAIIEMKVNRPQASVCRNRALLFNKDRKANEYMKLYAESSTSMQSVVSNENIVQ